MDLLVIPETKEEAALATAMLSTAMKSVIHVDVAAAFCGVQYYKCCLFCNAKFGVDAPDNLVMKTMDVISYLEDALETFDEDDISSLSEALIGDWEDTKRKYFESKEG